MKRLFSTLIAVLLPASCQSGGPAETTYPSRPITYYVPWNPGGGTDSASRALAAVLSNTIGRPVTVVNRTGGGGIVGHLALARAKADGYTIGAITVEITMMHWTGLTDLAPRDFAYLALLMNNPAAVTVRADAPWQTLPELLGAVRDRPGALLASGTSRGGIWDLARIGMLQAAGLPESSLPWVPSQGIAPALQELIAGGVHVVTGALAEVEALRQAGQVRVLAVMSEKRQAEFPDVPTLAEYGIDWSLGGWVAVGAPAGVPADVQTRLIEAIREAARDSAYLTPMRQAGFNLQVLLGEDVAAFMAEQDSISGRLLALAGLTN